jgi:DNA-binding transcriptional ArsR family regulator
MATRNTTKASVAKTSVNQSTDARRAPAAKPAAKTGGGKQAHPPLAHQDPNDDQMFEMAAEMFRVMSAPMRLKIINCLCSEEKNVGQLLEEIDTTQPNMSQHLNTLFKAKILGRRREGVQIYYRIVNDRVVSLCRAVCTQIAIDSHLTR